MKLFRQAPAILSATAITLITLAPQALADLTVPGSSGGGGVSVGSSNYQLNPNGDPSFTSNIFDFKGSLVNIATNVINIILIIAGILAVIYLIWSGIQYIMSAGNADKVKSARAGIINAILGIIVIVAAYFIIRFAVGVGNFAANSAGA